VKRVLATGGAGFIGTHLARELLNKGYSVELLDNFSRGVLDQELRFLSENKNVKIIDGDLLKRETFAALSNEYSYIFHLAAIVGVAHVLNRPYAVLTDNITMLTSMLEFAKKQKKLQRFLFASTSEVYAGTLQYFTLPIPTPENTPLTVTDLKHNRTSYMLSKIYGEALCHHSGIPFTIIRPHNVYGPRMGMSHVIPELFQKGYSAKSGAGIEIASVNHRRTFCYVDDAVEMIIRAVEKQSCENETLNIGNECQELSIGSLANEIFGILNKDQKAIPAQETPGSPTRRCPDMKHTYALTGYRPAVTLKDGLKKTYDWYRENIFSGRSEGAK
jgi:nucleoside-diphosphate-sugar epimerase